MARKKFEKRNGWHVGIFPADHELGFISGRRGLRRNLIKIDELKQYSVEIAAKMLEDAYHAKQYEILNAQAKQRDEEQKKKRQRSKTTLRQASKKWLDEIKSTHDKRTHASYKQTIDIYFQHCPDILASEFGRAENSNFLIVLKNLSNARNKNKTISASTQNMHMRQFQVFLNWCYDSEYISKIIRLKKPKKPVKEMETLTTDELEKLAEHLRLKSLEKFDKRETRKYRNLYRAFMLARHTLLRSGAIWALKLECIDLDRRTIHVKENVDLNWSPKGMKWPVKPINNALFEFLSEDLANRTKEEKYFLDNSLGRPWYFESKKLGAALGAEIKAIGLPGHIKPFHWGIRATLITKLLNDGVNPTDVQKLADHSSLTTTMLYFNARKASQENAVNFLDSQAIQNHENDPEN